MSISRLAGIAARSVLLLAVLGLLAGVSQAARAGQGEQHLPGKFAWFDLVTDDIESARRFYGEVFGWTFRTVGEKPGSYTFVELAGTRIAGILQRPAPAGTQRNARWLVLISVDDPAKARDYVEQQGGSVLVPLATVKGRGTHALFRDPDGAVFGVLKPEGGDRPDTPVADGDFFWVDLLARDPERAARFYSGLAGYEVSPGEDDTVRRVTLSSEGYARAGIVPKPEAVQQPGWLPYVLVEDVRATLGKVTAAGGSVLVEPRPDVLDGNLAVVADPRGGVLGIVNWQGGADDAGEEQK
jgi:predicted enzyme related to lactoylglutathione lyase